MLRRPLYLQCMEQQNDGTLSHRQVSAESLSMARDHRSEVTIPPEIKQESSEVNIIPEIEQESPEVTILPEIKQESSEVTFPLEIKQEISEVNIIPKIEQESPEVTILPEIKQESSEVTSPLEIKQEIPEVNIIPEIEQESPEVTILPEIKQESSEVTFPLEIKQEIQEFNIIPDIEQESQEVTYICIPLEIEQESPGLAGTIPLEIEHEPDDHPDKLFGCGINGIDNKGVPTSLDEIRLHTVEDEFKCCLTCGIPFHFLGEREVNKLCQPGKRLMCQQCGDLLSGEVTKLWLLNQGENLHNDKPGESGGSGDLSMRRCFQEVSSKGKSDKKLTSSTELAKHRLVHQGQNPGKAHKPFRCYEQRPFGCNICSRSYPTLRSLSRHMAYHVEDPMHWDVCGTIFNCPPRLMYKCGMCGGAVAQLKLLDLHVASECPRINAIKNGQSPANPICGQRSIDARHSQQSIKINDDRQLLDHTGGPIHEEASGTTGQTCKLFGCNICGQWYSTVRKISIHMVVHADWDHWDTCTNATSFTSTCSSDRSDNKKMLYSCKMCGELFPQLTLVSRHGCLRSKCSESGQSPATPVFPLRSDDTVESPLKCRLCGDSYQRNSSVHRCVKNVPTQKKASLVSLQGACKQCGKTFECLSELKKHWQVHWGEPPVTCEKQETRFDKDSNPTTSDASLDVSTPSPSSRQRHLAVEDTAMCPNEQMQASPGNSVSKVTRLVESFHNPSKDALPRTAEPEDDHSRAKQPPLKDRSVEHSTPEFQIEPTQAFLSNEGTKAKSSIISKSGEMIVKNNTKSQVRDVPHVRRSLQIMNFPKFKCDFCEKSFKRPLRLEEHMRIHTGERPFRCHFCGKGFRGPQYLMLHKLLSKHDHGHTNETVFQCEVCGKLFNTLYNLKVHSIHHSVDRPFKCHICPKSFKRATCLNVHQRDHTGEKPYKCDTCSKTFKRLPNLKYHMYVHLGKKPFKCEFCPRSFVTAPTLRRHLPVHTGELLYRCETCGQRFKFHCGWKKHTVRNRCKQSR